MPYPHPPAIPLPWGCEAAISLRARVRVMAYACARTPPLCSVSLALF